ncbi:ribosomal-protein-alanine N-acetyltransferase [Clostridium liquoris]|jgi:ribosomal-protein-alanine N-acetyltransferase|uniref:[Ribosomal protein bS18]-alanine N-acetyltransferase n=1 Tax=Clostridium liquoris TaxID=1289519 RepID=A0A2T0B562_9CLOT|nr:ribosomal protein S18-alanine N-acetyltransferase [Clostridium liquoris]PRR79016.1 ribosomal-protein-alanine N-acetyltransferase [Clostridium liquoris]
MINDEIQTCKASLYHIDEMFIISTLSFPISWSKESIKKEIMENDQAIYLVAIKDNTVIGYGGVWVILDEGHITNIAVHPEFRNTGVATLILDDLIEACKANSVQHMTLEVRTSNIVAISLYKSFNFIEEGIRKRYYADNGEDALIMWKHYI